MNSTTTSIADGADQLSAPTKTRVFTLINAYSVKNVGDAGIVVATVNLLRVLFPGCTINVMSSNDADNKDFYARRQVRSVGAVWHLDGGAMQRYATGAAKWLSHSFGVMDPPTQPIVDADLVISVGGGYLYSSRKGPAGVGLLCVLFHIWLAKRCGKAVLIGPKSFGPIRWDLDSMLIRHVLGSGCRLLARERQSAAYLTGLGLTGFELVPDIAFTLLPKPGDLDVSAYAEGAPRVGITVLDWRFAKPGTDEAVISVYLDSVKKACQLVKERYQNAHFYIFPQVAVSNDGLGDSDYFISKRLAESLGESASLVEVSAIEEPERAIAIYSLMDCFIASRMHSAIFALCGGVPTIALAYQTKTTGTFELLGLENNVLDIQDFDSDVLFQRLAGIIDGGAIEREKVRGKVDSARTRALSLFSNSVLDMLNDPRYEAGTLSAGQANPK